MKMQVGQRTHVPDLELRAVMAFASLCCTAQVPATKKIYPGKCKNCGEPVEMSLSEDVQTGQIWCEGSDDCPKCHYRLAAENPLVKQLSQEAIERLFGKF